MKLEINNRKEIHKHMEIKQHIFEQPLGQKRNPKRKFLKILKQMKMETCMPKLKDAC